MYKLNYLPTFSPLYKITKSLSLILADPTNSRIIVFIHFVHVCTLQQHTILGRYMLYNNCTPLITTPDSGEQYLLYFSRVVCSECGAKGSAIFAHTSPEEEYWLKSVLGCTFADTDPDIINLVCFLVSVLKVWNLF